MQYWENNMVWPLARVQILTNAHEYYTHICGLSTRFYYAHVWSHISKDVCMTRLCTRSKAHIHVHKTFPSFEILCPPILCTCTYNQMCLWFSSLLKLVLGGTHIWGVWIWCYVCSDVCALPLCNRNKKEKELHNIFTVRLCLDPGVKNFSVTPRIYGHTFEVLNVD